MVLPDDDLRVLRRCRPASCGFKLLGPELAWLKPALAGSGPEADARLRQAFREVVLARLRAYQNGGHSALGQCDDDSTSRPLDGDFAATGVCFRRRRRHRHGWSSVGDFAWWLR